jgi:hypothetical protein
MRHVLTCLLLFLLSLTTEAQVYQLRTGKAPVRMTAILLSDGWLEDDVIDAISRSQAAANGFIDQPLWTNVLETTRLPASESWDAVLAFYPSQVAGTSYWGRYTNNTRYGCMFNFNGYSERLMASLNERQAQLDAYSTGLKSNTVVIVLANSAIYGGSGGQICYGSWNQSALEIVRHEMGHTFGHLGDEYSTAYPGYPAIEEPNTTRETNRNNIKWAAWIKASTPVPTPPSAAYAGEVGLFEGAHYNATGWYRPRLHCKMRELGQPYCEVCTKTMLDTLMLKTPFPPNQIPFPGIRSLRLTSN